MKIISDLRKISICENDFGYHPNIKAYVKLSLDTNELYAMVSKGVNIIITGDEL